MSVQWTTLHYLEGSPLTPMGLSKSKHIKHLYYYISFCNYTKSPFTKLTNLLSIPRVRPMLVSIPGARMALKRAKAEKTLEARRRPPDKAKTCQMRLHNVLICSASNDILLTT